MVGWGGEEHMFFTIFFENPPYSQTQNRQDTHTEKEIQQDLRLIIM
jgi:hypothetical protein